MPYSVNGEGRLDVPHANLGRHFVQRRYEVVSERRGLELPGLVVVELFVERGADALRRPAADVAGERHRIHHRAGIVDRDIVENLHLAGFRIDLHQRHMAHMPHDGIEDAVVVSGWSYT